MYGKMLNFYNGHLRKKYYKTLEIMINLFIIDIHSFIELGYLPDYYFLFLNCVLFQIKQMSK